MINPWSSKHFTEILSEFSKVPLGQMGSQEVSFCRCKLGVNLSPIGDSVCDNEWQHVEYEIMIMIMDIYDL